MTLRQDVNRFWPIFLSTHLDPRNRRCHLLGNGLFFGFLAAFCATGRWSLLALAFTGYLPSWLGHWLFEGKAPVTFGRPFVSGLCDLKMIGFFLAGQLDGEIERLFGAKRPARGAMPIVTMDDELRYQEDLRWRIRAAIPSHPFRTYWPVFLLKHQRPINVWLHVLAMVLLYALIATSVVTRRWELLLLIPLSQLLGLVAHAVWERNYIDFEDALFSLRAFSCLNRMLVLVLTGQYWQQVAGVQSELARWQEAQARAKSL